MDVNETRYHLILGQEDWNCAAREHVAWDEAQQAMALESLTFEFRPPPGEVPVSLAARRGAACDRFGNTYWIAEDDHQILVRSSGSGATSIFWPLASTVCEAQPVTFAPSLAGSPSSNESYRGLTVTLEHFLVVGTLAPNGLLVFDLHAGGPPRRFLWDDPNFAPFDLAPRPCGGVWLLERQLLDGVSDSVVKSQLWALNRHFQRIGVQAQATRTQAVFQPLDGPADRLEVMPNNDTPMLLLRDGLPINAIAIESLGDDVLLLERGSDLPSGLSESDFEVRHHRIDLTASSLNLVRYGTGILARAVVQVEIAGATPTDPVKQWPNIAHDFVLTQIETDNTGSSATATVVDAQGNQAFAFSITFDSLKTTLKLLANKRFLPLRRFAGKGLVSDPMRSPHVDPSRVDPLERCQTGVYYDFADTWLELIEQPSSRYRHAGKITTSGEFTTNGGPFDAHEPDTVWHRLMLEGEFPPETGVHVFTRSDNNLKTLTQQPWLPEPDPYRRPTGSELPLVARNTNSYAGVLELLFQRTQGRYLQIKLELFGNGRSTPRMRALRAYAPRFSYMTYLPTVYRDDAESGDLLERLLANPEGTLTMLEDRIVNAQALFDPRIAPEETLDWLGAWFGLALDPTWDAARRRLFLRHALRFLAARGTLRGLRMALRLALETCVDEEVFADTGLEVDPKARPFGIRILERFRTRQTQADATERRRTAHRFRVLIPVPLNETGSMERQQQRLGLARRVIELQKPAHTAFDVRLYWAAFLLGEARLGLETSLDQNGSRNLRPPMVLGQGYLLEAQLSAAHPMNVHDRNVLGRDSLP